MASVDRKMWRFGFANVGKSFRGPIWENCKRFKLVGKAYDAMPHEQNGHFLIETVRHLMGPLMALLDPNVRIVIIIGATQVMKSVAGDIWIPYLLEHCLRNILVLFETDPKALVYCDTRFMDTIKQHPVLSKLLGEVSRHDVTKTEIKIAGAKLMVGGLNDSNVSSLSWPFIWVSEAWQHRVDGLLRKAIKRADRFPHDKKILIESQAGFADEDLHTEAKAAHQVPLTWACPLCGGRQTWECTDELATVRPDDFQPRPRFDGTGEPPKPGTFAGMNFAPAENLTLDERARTARWECYHCGGLIEDTRANRQAIMDSYEQDYQITRPDGSKVSPKVVCFTLPKEAARDNSFEDSTKAYLTAKESERAGNLVPLQNWYMSDRAIFYSARLNQPKARAIVGSYEIKGAIPNEVARVMSVDCQQDPDLSSKDKSIIGHFWYDAWAIDRQGKNIFQLARGYAKSWGEWIAVKNALKIPTANVAIDGGNWLDEVIDAAAKHHELGKPVKRGKKILTPLITWAVMRGNGVRGSFKHEDKISRVFSQPSVYQREVQINGVSQVVNVFVFEWSNLSVKDQFAAIFQGGEGKPKVHILPREKLNAVTQDKEKGSCTYQQQIANEHRGRKNNRNIWIEDNPNVHYKDCGCMNIVQLGRGGHIGHIAVTDEEQQEG